MTITAADSAEFDASCQFLEQQSKDYITELTILLALQQAIIRRLSDPEVFPQLLADEIRRLGSVDCSAVFSLEGEDLNLFVYSGIDSIQLEIGCRMPLRDSVAERALHTGRSIRLCDTYPLSSVDTEFMACTGLRSLVLVPLLAPAEPMGILLVGNRDGRELGDYVERLLELLAPGLIIGMKTTTLYRKEQERWEEAEKRRRVAEVLGNILTVINSNRPLNEILNHIAMQASQVLGCEAVAICRLNSAEQLLTVQAAYGMGSDYLAIRIPADHLAVGRAVQERRPVIVSNIVSFLADQSPPPVFAQTLAEHFRALLAVPLTIKNEVYGCIVLYYPTPQNFSDEEVSLAVMFSDQVALAIENARLRAQTEQAAVAAERSRLARDLHDAVTQTLFSASLIAEVLPDVWERNMGEGKRLLGELRQLSRGALAEMRSLLLELRPSGLVEANLGDLLHQIAEALTGRTGIQVETAVEDPGPLPTDVKVALYRIAQEALNNVAKHGHATQVSLCLCPYRTGGKKSRVQTGVRLSIHDNGRGFEPARVTSNHLGLGIMQERAAAIGAVFRVKSHPGKGTQIGVMWKQHSQAEEL